ncbi:MAG: hypothetical protein EOP56_07795 [Sphingobacteriales bacterium]|nr:MAG: hypothetical protein EOP56_07795 [Sphingobacteriales bacterium]
MKKLMLSLAMFGLIHSANAQCKCQGQKKKSKSKTTSVAKAKPAPSKNVATKPTQIVSMPSTANIGLTGKYLDTMQERNETFIRMQEVQPWGGYADDVHETRSGYMAVPIPEYSDIATEENMNIRGEGQIPHRNINMRGTNPAKNSFEQDLEILNRYDKMRGKMIR